MSSELRQALEEVKDSLDFHDPGVITSIFKALLIVEKKIAEVPGTPFKRPTLSQQEEIIKLEKAMMHETCPFTGGFCRNTCMSFEPGIVDVDIAGKIRPPYCSNVLVSGFLSVDGSLI